MINKGWFIEQYASYFSRLYEADGRDVFANWAENKDQEVMLRTFQAISGMNTNPNQTAKPKLGLLKRTYYQQTKHQLAERAPVVDCDLCKSDGWVYVVLGGDGPNNCKVLLQPKKCDYYSTQIIPCKCSKGMYLNAHRWNYSNDILNRLHKKRYDKSNEPYDIFFSTPVDASIFIDECNALPDHSSETPAERTAEVVVPF